MTLYIKCAHCTQQDSIGMYSPNLGCWRCDRLDYRYRVQWYNKFREYGLDASRYDPRYNKTYDFDAAEFLQWIFHPQRVPYPQEFYDICTAMARGRRITLYDLGFAETLSRSALYARKDMIQYMREIANLDLLENADRSPFILEVRAVLRAAGGLDS